MTKPRANRRNAERHKVLWYALACQSSPSLELSCVIKDLSETGCQLVGVRIDGMKPKFLLQCATFEAPVACEVVWRKKRAIGVRFTEAVRFRAVEEIAPPPPRRDAPPPAEVVEI